MTETQTPTETAEEIRYIKPPLENVASWPDVPPYLKGRVILKRWPMDEFSEGGIVLPGRSKAQTMGVAWVVRAIGEQASKYLGPGDSVIVPEYAIGNGLLFPGEGNEDLSEIDASSIYHRLRYVQVLKHFETACLAAESELAESAPQIQALISGGEFDGARAWCGRLASKEDRLSTDSRKLLSSLATQAETERRVCEAALAAEKEMERDRARAKLINERMDLVSGQSTRIHKKKPHRGGPRTN